MAAAGRGCLTLCHVGSGCAALAAGRSAAERFLPWGWSPLPCGGEGHSTAGSERDLVFFATSSLQAGQRGGRVLWTEESVVLPAVMAFSHLHVQIFPF